MHGGTHRLQRLVGVLVVVLLLAGVSPASASGSPAGFSIRNGRLIDGYGNDFIMRGVNHPHSWFESRTSSLGDIKSAGANTVRIVLSTGARYQRTSSDGVRDLATRCESLRLVCVFEVHDTTGFPGVPNSISLDAAVDYWLEMQPMLTGTEAFSLINIGNEPFDNQAFDRWQGDTMAAVQRLRDGGYTHTLMIDAPNWGQDWSFTMRDGAAAVMAQDPHQNLLFDVHMYGVFDTADKVRSYIESFVRQELPLVIGEFGAMHTDGDPDERAVFHWSALYGVGSLAWSWSGNVHPVAPLNIVEEFDPDRITAWGDQVLSGATGVASPSIEASIFGDPETRPMPLLATAPEVAEPEVHRATPRRIDIVEAEAGVWNGLIVSVAGNGFSGAGFLTGFDARGDSVTVTVNVDEAGPYDLVFGYRSRHGDKTQNLIVNGSDRSSVDFAETPEFRPTVAQPVILQAGQNTVMLQHDWGWIDLDYVEIWTTQ